MIALIDAALLSEIFAPFILDLSVTLLLPRDKHVSHGWLLLLRIYFEIDFLANVYGCEWCFFEMKTQLNVLHANSNLKIRFLRFVWKLCFLDKSTLIVLKEEFIPRIFLYFSFLDKSIFTVLKEGFVLVKFKNIIFFNFS